MLKRTHTARAGYTLTEVMVVVAILAVLAAIAVPVYTTYSYKAKTSEAVSFLHEIAAAQEIYLGEVHSYCSASADEDSFNPRGPSSPLPPSAWTGTATWDPDLDNWRALAPTPPGNQLMFGYNSVAGTTDSAPGWLSDAPWTPPDRPWFVSRAVADLNGDGVFVTFWSFSDGARLFISEESGWE